MLNTLRLKILFLVGGPIAVILIVAAGVLVNNIGNRTEESVHESVESMVAQEALGIEAFFEKYGHIAKTFMENPYFVKWFSDLTERNANLNQVEGYDLVNNTFKQVSGADDNIDSAFFGSGNTFEYFREDERTGEDQNYYTNKRPWWTKTLELNKYYIGSPSADLTTGKVSTVVEGPVYLNGTLVGIGGLDLKLNQVRDRVSQIKFKDRGLAFLLDEKGRVVVFPKNELTRGFKIYTTKYDGDAQAIVDASGKEVKEHIEVEFNQLIKDFDTHETTSGFAELAPAFKSGRAGTAEVEFRGESYFLAYQPTKLEFPHMNWTLGLMIPMELIDDPISKAMWGFSTVVLIMLGGIAALMMYVANKITRPVRLLSHAMQDVAEGDGDLTKTIDVDSNDEMGVLADHFNTFIAKLRGLLQQTNSHSHVVNDASVHLSRVSSATNDEIQQEKVQVDSVTTAVTEMAATVQEISRNAAEANSAANEAERHASTGNQLSNDAMNQMNDLAASMEEAVQTVAGLGEESKNIGSVIDVINGIAEQTNLLALNAAIEAARAGEQGRGFAVVADEVRSLASRTQDSTKDISTMVAKLRNIAQAAETVMSKGQSQTAVGVDKTQQVQQALEAINHSIATVQEQSGHIAVATEEQTVVAESINESLHSITGLMDSTANHAAELSSNADELSDAATDLHNIVGSFKV